MAATARFTHLDRPLHARFVRKTHQHAESSWRLGKHIDSPNEFLGDLVAMLGGLDSISEHEYLAYRPLILTQGRGPCHTHREG